jgi:hypothetical protein
MIQFIKVCGFAGFLCLLSTFCLLVACIAVACTVKSRKGLALLAVLALLPLLIGAAGTAASYSQIARGAKSAQPQDQPMIQRGQEEARCPAYLGLGCTLSLLLVIGLAATLKKREEESNRRIDNK